MTWIRKRVGVVAGVVVVAGALVLGACSEGDGGSDAASAEPVTGVTEVVAKDVEFNPVAIEVPAGTTVTWKFDDGGLAHDVEGDGWGSGEPQSDGTFEYTFDSAGTYDYVCTLHSGMDGKVVVTSS